MSDPLDGAPIVAAAIERFGLLDGLTEREVLDAMHGLAGIERVLRGAGPDNKLSAFRILLVEPRKWTFIRKPDLVDTLREVALAYGLIDFEIQEELAEAFTEPVKRRDFEDAPPHLNGNGHAKEARVDLPATGPLRKRLDVFLAEYVPLAYAIEPIIRNGSLYTLTGKTGTGKTGLLIDIALAVATGKQDILNREVERGRVIYTTIENPDDIRMRLTVVADRLGIDIANIAESIDIIDRKVKPEEILADLANAGPLKLIIIDTFAAMFDGDNINDAVQAGNFMRRLRPLTRLQGRPAVICAAHPVKNAGPDQLIPYGSGAILNEVDGNLVLWRNNGIASVHWQGKLRGIEFEPAPFKTEPWACHAILDNKGRQVSLPVLLPTTAEVAEEREAAVGRRNKAVLVALRLNPQAPQRELMIAAGVSMGALSRALSALEKRRFIEKGADGKWRLTKRGESETDA